MARHRDLLIGATAVLATLLTGCSSSAPHRAAPKTRPSTTAPPSSATTATTTATTAPPATAPPATAPPTTTLIGLVLNGNGATLVPPASPTTVPFNGACQALIDPGFYGACVTVTAPSGTIGAITESQQNQGGANVAIQERDLVYRRVGGTYSLALRRVTTATNGAGNTSTLWESDVNRDGDPKAVFVTPAPNSQYGNELDVVEATGVVTLYRQLHGGFATIAPGGGLETFVPSSTSGYDEAVIKYSGGAWRIASTAHVSATQGKADNNGPFSDPQGQRAQYG
ncbi:MAG: hypothetical protein ACYC1D_09875 [Acidimicrobiales bacterium]